MCRWRCAWSGTRSATAQVTDEVMQKMAERLKPPTFKEGFEKITVVRVKGQPGAASRMLWQLRRRLQSSFRQDKTS